jgi:hypothetical protein
MEVEFVLRPDDVMAFHEYVWDHPPKGGRGYRGLSWVWLVLLGLLSLLSVPSLIQGDWSLYVIWGPLMFVTFLLLKLFWRPLLRRQVRKTLEQKADQNAKQLGWKRLTLSPESLIAVSEHRTVTICWAGIEKIVIAGERALIFDSPTSAHVVPRRAFADEDEFRDFVAIARRYRDAAKDDRPQQRAARRKRSGEDDTGIKPGERADL